MNDLRLDPSQPVNAARHLPLWTASPQPDHIEPGPALSPLSLSPSSINRHWQPLIQSWHTGATDPDFQPGWAQIRWDETGLHYDALFMGAGARNSARHLNEKTWELGDVGEIFVETGTSPTYLELHVTPENSRLQLHWTADGLTRVRNKAATLEDFMIGQHDWVQSRAKVGPNFWAFQVSVPAARFGLARLHAGQLLRTAVCRYHYQKCGRPALSSPALRPSPFFHHREGWHPLLLDNAH